jgi:hypothetical protein
MKKVFITIAFIFSINSNAFEKLYLTCANGTHFFGITQTIPQRLQDPMSPNSKKVTVKRATVGYSQFESDGAEGVMFEETIDLPYFGYIDRVEGILYQNTGDFQRGNPVRIGSCKKISKSQALAGAKRIGFKAKTKTKF